MEKIPFYDFKLSENQNIIDQSLSENRLNEQLLQAMQRKKEYLENRSQEALKLGKELESLIDQI